MKSLLTAICLGLTALILPATAGAHVEISPTRAPASKPVTLKFEVGHGCDGDPTIRLTALMPASSVASVRPLPISGWKAGTAGNRIVWKGGPLADHDTAQFPFKVTLAGKKGEEIAFKVIQNCVGGSETAWIQTGGDEGQLENPAPTVRLTSTGELPVRAENEQKAEPGKTDTTKTDATRSDDQDSGSVLKVIGLILIVAAVTSLVVRARSRRSG